DEVHEQAGVEAPGRHQEHGGGDDGIDPEGLEDSTPRDLPSRIPRHVTTVSAMRVGVLTGGGDCPGLNAVIRAIVRKGEMVYGDQVIGFLDAWDGVMTRTTMPLDVRSLRGMLPRGGTLLGTRRGSPFEHADGLALVKSTFEEMGLDALVVIGGNGSLTV